MHIKTTTIESSQKDPYDHLLNIIIVVTIYYKDRTFTISLAIGDTLLLTIHGASTTSASTAVSFPGAAKRAETPGRTPQLLPVTRSFLFASHRRSHHTSFPVPAARTTVASAVSTADSGSRKPVSESGYPGISRSWYTGES